MSPHGKVDPLNIEDFIYLFIFAFIYLFIYFVLFFYQAQPEPNRHTVAPFDKVTASNDCSGNVAHEPFFFCIATTNVPLIIASQPDSCVHIIDNLRHMSVLMCLEN